ncbi:cysteine hydrolase family protein [Pseudarthrobacter sp. SSS035]|uniref:cysteine hydrolase family protein n=1 Tax=Pseudarthrobacter sp. SSS035 TaxID=2931399 RepID=UPI00200BD71C|nr:isochorismatase family cysteine hydrolase [Pseudarthrobacter sp. SSS035]
MDELLDPSTTALVVIDMQIGGLTPGHAHGDAGLDLSMMPRVTERCGAAIAGAREHGVPIFHIRVENLPNGASSSPVWLRALHTASGDKPVDLARLSTRGDPATGFIQECAPIDGEIVITKRRQSAFVSTELALLLRGMGIESVALVGVSTGGCVEATVRDAVHNDFYAVLLEDAVGAYDVKVHEAALTVMKSRHDVTTVDALLDVWQRADTRAGVRS